ncbi:hypothetical protein BDQ17DRAFT_1359645 [Cyathus striatus]|nr:hypothetical protein BDQ17DRAFT_1359645 [Cyathus striatus]
MAIHRITLPKLLLASLTFLFIYLYTSPLPPPLPLTPHSTSCTPGEYANGSWAPIPARTAATIMSEPEQALSFSGFEGCASSREFYWHLASDTPGQYERFPKAQSYAWEPSSQCGIAPLDGGEMVKEMVQGGGWLLIGEPLLLLSCLLYPHVRATPNYTANPHWDRAWPQNLYLSPTSPLLHTLSLPPGFDIHTTPLVTFRRIDLLVDQAELDMDTPCPNLPRYFHCSLPGANYATMIVSTGGHWTTTLLSGLKDESKPGDGIDSVLQLFEVSMQYWAKEVQERLWSAQRGSRGRGMRRRVLVRAYLPGHEDCHSHREPWKEIVPFVWGWYNWGRFGSLMGFLRFKVVSDKTKYPDIHYLGIDRPARLRPDAHTTGDCLHIMTGAGVLEGWSHYIWHYVTRELRR